MSRCRVVYALCPVLAYVSSRFSKHFISAARILLSPIPRSKAAFFARMSSPGPRSNQLSPRRIIDVTDGASLPNTLTRVRGEKAAINFDNELFMSQFDEHLQEVLRDEEDINELRK